MAKKKAAAKPAKQPAAKPAAEPADDKPPKLPGRPRLRGRGKPRPGERIVTPAVLAQISRQWLEGVPVTTIADEIGVDESTIRGHIARRIRPVWERDLQDDRTILLAKVAHLERTAWERFHSNAPAETIESVKSELTKALDQAMPEKKGANKKTVDKLTTSERNVRKVFRPGQTAWLQIVEWCLEYRAKIDGLFAPQKHEINTAGFLRVAGSVRGESDEEMLKRWKQAVQERMLRAQSLN